MNKLIKSKVLIGKIGILIVILSICLGLFQRQMVNAHATTSNELPFDVSFKDKFTVLDPAGKKGRTWKATVTGDGLYYGTLGVWAETSDLSTQEKNKQFAELNKFPGIEAVESKYSILGGKEKIVFGVFIRNKTSAEIQDYLNNCLYINSPNVENGVQDFKITGKVLNKYVNITYKADTESNNGNGTVTVNSKKLEKNGSMDVKLNKNLDKYIDTPVTITMTPEPGSYVDGISINGVTQRYNGPEEKTYTIPNITEHTTITPSFSLAGTDITHGVDGNNRNQGNLAWVDTRTNLTYKEALEFNYNAKDFRFSQPFSREVIAQLHSFQTEYGSIFHFAVGVESRFVESSGGSPQIIGVVARSDGTVGVHRAGCPVVDSSSQLVGVSAAKLFKQFAVVVDQVVAV